MRLGIPGEKATQLAALFERRGQLAFELERLGRLGIWHTTVESEEYPGRLLDRLGSAAPPVLFGLGQRELFAQHGLAVVGSRDAGASVVEVARIAGAQAARQGWITVTGGARGVDRESMRGAFDEGGSVAGVPADGLERHLRDAALRTAFTEGRAAYVSPHRPDAPFSAGAAMGRNRLIYGLASVALVVHCEAGGGEAWSGAIEALEAGSVPVYVHDAGARAAGNDALIRHGGRRLDLGGLGDLHSLASPNADPRSSHAKAPGGEQQTLF
jgi:predicted Rossmann fold nucleotide-binding protein DprA/Smf involved in DNA uptake